MLKISDSMSDDSEEKSLNIPFCLQLYAKIILVIRIFYYSFLIDQKENFYHLGHPN